MIKIMRFPAGLILAPLLACTTVVAADNKPASAAVASETREIAAFHSINQAMPADVSYRVAATPGLKVIAPKELLPSIIALVKNGELVLAVSESHPPFKPGQVRFEISSPSLQAVSLSSAGDIAVSGLKSGDLMLVLAGAGDIKLTGAVDSITINLTGAGDIDAAGLKAKKLKVDIFGRGNINAFASQFAHVHLMGEGHVTVAGNPPEKIREAHGTGDITFIP